MKKLIFILCIITLFQSKTSSQSIQFAQDDKKCFEVFIEKIPIYEYPVINSWDYDKMTKFNKKKPNLDKNLVNVYICKYLQCYTDNCPNKFFFDIVGLAKFDTDSAAYQMILLTLDMETGCTEQDYLISYSPLSGEIIDTLTVFSKRMISQPNEKYIWGESAYIESLIKSATTIEILCIDKLGEIFKENGKKSRRIRTTKRIYNVSQEGKFEKIEEFLVSDQIEQI